MTFKILQGDNRDTLKTLADNSIDAIVTDPPYGIDFLGKAWDANTGALETYQECLRVLKPGGHILAFSAARTYHHLAVTLEQAGFEIRDQIMWIYSSGFPKSQDIGRSIQRSLGVKEKKQKTMVMQGGFKNMNNSWEDKMTKKENETVEQVVCTDPEAKQWEGWGTALKPAHEPIALARKPLHKDNSIARNCQQWGTGAINIDATRVGWGEDEIERIRKENASGGHPGGGIDKYSNIGEKGDGYKAVVEYSEQGRFPSNVIGEILQADYQKYFYCPKVSRKERHIGFDTDDIHTATNMLDEMKGYYLDTQGNPDPTRKDNGRMIWLPHTGVIYSHTLKEEYKMWKGKTPNVNSTKSMLETMGAYYIDKNGNPLAYEDRGDNPQIHIPSIGNIYTHGLKQEYLNWCKANNIAIGNVGNNHPTVKPVALMEYLIKLITPPGGTVLDPFNGSGSTGMAAVGLGFDYIGCELDPAYVAITEKRIEAWIKQDAADNNFEDLFSAVE